MPEREKTIAEQFGSRVGGALKGASDFATAPARAMAGAAEAGRSAVADFGRGVMNPQQPFAAVSTAQAGENQRDSGFVPGGGAPATAFRGGQGHTGRSSADVSQFLDDDRSRERARNDPATGNPQGGDDFMQKATDQAMTDNPVAYTGGADETGAGGYGAPGSSGTPGPGGTVSTISAENFVKPSGAAAGDAAVNRARRDFQLRQEGNADLASDATPDEKIAARREEIQNELRTLNFGTNQSFSQLANNKARARQLQQEMARLDQKEQGITAGETAAAERGFEARENQLDRQNELRKATIENVMGGGNLKVGGTEEAIKNKMVNEGFDSLTPEENFLVTERIREQAIADLTKENFGEPVTQDQIQKRMDLMLGQLKQAASKSSEAADQSTDKLASTGTGKPPPQAMEQLKQAGPGKQVRFKNGQVWMLDENGNPTQVEQAR